MPRTDDSAAYAGNWRAVLAFDAVLGVVGILVVAVGAAYTALVGARARRWARLRREAGL